MSNEYKVISEFCCCGKPMVTVMIGNAAHVMSQENGVKFARENISIDRRLKLLGSDL